MRVAKGLCVTLVLAEIWHVTREIFHNTKVISETTYGYEA